MWYFRPKSPGEKIRNPIQGEFFSTDAIAGPAQALVRESVQNSLDAAIGSGPVSVKFRLCSGEAALPANQSEELFGAAWPHFAAPRNGLRDAPDPAARCPYLLIEDYGTKGLTGDPAQSDPDPDPAVKNPFFLFFRAEGLSAKAGTELGRWGIGKFVFPRSSLASTHFGIALRHDDGRRLLLGAVTLKAHRIAGNPTQYTPDGLYGRPPHEGFVEPIQDSADIDDFCRMFRVTRTTEAGLSVVVPFVDPEITFEALLLASAQDYILPILNGKLEITIADGTRVAKLTRDTLDAVLAAHETELGDSVAALVRLTRFAINTTDGDRLTLTMPDAARAAKWSDDLIGTEVLTQLQARLTSGNVVAVRVPDHDLTRQVLRLADLPVAAPSANLFGRLSPTTARHVEQQLGDRIDGILDGGPCRIGVESTILAIDGERAILLRPGGIPVEELESLIGRIDPPLAESEDHPSAPGMLASHYAPQTPLTIVAELPAKASAPLMGLLALAETDFRPGFAAVEILSSTGDLVVAAANFFQALHRLDAAGLDRIVAVAFPENGLGRALNDRLRRAANRNPTTFR